jgi:Na+/H+ antiporter NhaD/arsenite permease-like protein
MADYIYKFKTTLKQQFIILSPLLFTVIGISLVFKYILKISLSDIAFIGAFSFLLLMDILPTIILHTGILDKEPWRNINFEYCR